VISSSQRPLPDNTRHSQQTNIHAPGGIRTYDLSRWAACGRSPAEIVGDEADLLVRSLRMRRSHSTQAQSTASHCRLTSPTGEWLLTDAQYNLLWLAAKLHQGHATGSRDIQNGRILSVQPPYIYVIWHKFHHQLTVQCFCIYYTQFLHALGIYPVHIQGVTSFLSVCSLCCNLL